MARKVIKWYEPSIGIPTWNIKEMNNEERANIRDRLVMGIVHIEEEYQTVIGYMYKKYPHLMDITGKVTNPFTGEVTENTSIQWNYKPHKNKVSVFNKEDKIKNIFDMYAFIYYDKERDYEPVCFAGSYFKNMNLDISNLTYENELEKLKNDINLSNGNIVSSAVGEGYVLFVDPYYRKLSLGSYSWLAESQLYRDIWHSNFENAKKYNNNGCYDNLKQMVLPIQAEIQNEYSIKSTIYCFRPTLFYPSVTEEDQLLFGEHSKHLYITSNGRVKNDGSRCQIRILMNYRCENLIESFNNMPNNMKQIYNKPHWEFLEREAKNNNMTIEEYKKELIKPWN